jgi:hypothetical protein
MASEEELPEDIPGGERDTDDDDGLGVHGISPVGQTSSRTQ